jgi:hypothetical protein
MLICTSQDCFIQEVYYNDMKCVHAIKSSVVTALDPKWLYQVHPGYGRVSDIAAWQTSKFPGLLAGMGLKVFGKKRYCGQDNRIVCPFESDQIELAAMQMNHGPKRGSVQDISSLQQ